MLMSDLHLTSTSLLSLLLSPFSDTNQFSGFNKLTAFYNGKMSRQTVGLVHDVAVIILLSMIDILLNSNH